MRSVARIGDLHACADEGPNTAADLKIQRGSPNITINGQPAARLGDPVSCRMATGESPVITEGSPFVLFNGKPAARMGDRISNGGSISSGSDTFFIGDGTCHISFGDGVKVRFGSGCNVFLNCRDANGHLPAADPPDPLPAIAESSLETQVATLATKPEKKWSQTSGGIAIVQCSDAVMQEYALIQAEKHWVEFQLTDVDGKPIPNQRYIVTDASGKVIMGFVDDNGYARVSPVKAGDCKVRFPDLDG